MSIDPTSVSYESYGHTPGESPEPLQIPYQLRSTNAPVPSKGVFGVGPQSGTFLNVERNLGSVIIPGDQSYLMVGGQNPVGILPRFVPVEHDQYWDAPYVMNPSIEVV